MHEKEGQPTPPDESEMQELELDFSAGPDFCVRMFWRLRCGTNFENDPAAACGADEKTLLPDGRGRDIRRIAQFNLRNTLRGGQGSVGALDV